MLFDSGGSYAPSGMRTQLIRVDRPNRRIRPVAGWEEDGEEVEAGGNGTDAVKRTLVLEFDP